MEIQENVPLSPLTTFKVGGPARYFAEINNEADIKEALDFAKEKDVPVFILGGGSNIVVSDSGFPGLVLHVNLKGRKYQENGEEILLTVAAGEIWDKVVAEAVDKGYWGLENLSHIPGRVGAVAVQNVGAYGQQAGNVIKEVRVWDTGTNEMKILSKTDCQFGYRKSIFNSREKGKYIILEITFVLSRIPSPLLSYGDVQKYFADRQVLSPNIAEIRKAIIEIRNRKYPFPTDVVGGNAGSFFKNPVLSSEKYSTLKKKAEVNFGEEIQNRLQEYRARSTNGEIKIPAAFLIEACGLKGKQIGGVKVNETQPLVLVNTGTATAEDIFQLSHEVQKRVEEKFGLQLEFEPQFVGS